MLARATSGLRLGADPALVWSEVARDDALAPLARAVSRSQQTGAPLAALLPRVADQARAEHRGRAEARIRTAAVRLTAPLGVAFLPAFVLLGVVPVVASWVGTLVSSRRPQAARVAASSPARRGPSRSLSSGCRSVRGSATVAGAPIREEGPVTRRLSARFVVPLRHRRSGRGSDAGAASAEYAVVTVAAAGLGGLLIKLLTSDWFMEILKTIFETIIRAALSFFGLG